jgi:hypothetical protein
MQGSKIDAILSAWKDEGEVLRYKRIKQFLVQKGIIKETNDRSPSRWLKNLVKMGLLEKTEKGYALKKRPKVYQVFDYLNELRQKYGNHIYEGEIGGFISHLCALTYLNFNEALIQTEEEQIAFNTLSIRIGELFWALYELRNAILKRRCGLAQLKLPDTVIREVFFGILNRSIGEHRSTEEIVKKYSRHLMQISKKDFDLIWKSNFCQGESFTDFLLDELILDEIEKDIRGYKKDLKEKASINLDKYTIDELVEKFIQINNWIKKKHEKEMKEHHSFFFTKEESELESNYRTAILTKVAERINALKTNTEDFAVVITRHPATMNEYYTPEHILKETIEWARKPPEDTWGKCIWQEIHEKEKTFEGMVAEQLITFGRFDVRTYAKMRNLPWVKREMSKYGDFNTILKLYSKKRKEYFRRRRKAFAGSPFTHINSM